MRKICNQRVLPWDFKFSKSMIEHEMKDYGVNLSNPSLQSSRITSYWCFRTKKFAKKSEGLANFTSIADTLNSFFLPKPSKMSTISDKFDKIHPFIKMLFRTPEISMYRANQWNSCISGWYLQESCHEAERVLVKMRKFAYGRTNPAVFPGWNHDRQKFAWVMKAWQIA